MTDAIPIPSAVTREEAEKFVRWILAIGGKNLTDEEVQEIVDDVLKDPLGPPIVR